MWKYLLYHTVKGLLQDLIVIVSYNVKSGVFRKDYESVTNKSGNVGNLTQVVKNTSGLTQTYRGRIGKPVFLATAGRLPSDLLTSKNRRL